MLDINDKSAVEKMELTKVLNGILGTCEPIHYSKFNLFVDQVDDKLMLLEKENDKIGVAAWRDPKDISKQSDTRMGISVLSLIATITDILVDDRLAVRVEMPTGIITEFVWHSECNMTKNKEDTK